MARTDKARLVPTLILNHFTTLLFYYFIFYYSTKKYNYGTSMWYRGTA